MKKATDEQRELYAQTKPVYPLGYVATCPIAVEGERRLVASDERLPVFVEDLRGSWSAPDPTWEAVAPEGYMFDGELHTMLGYNLKDIRERIQWAVLVPCFDSDNCSCTKQGHAIQRGVLAPFFD